MSYGFNLMEIERVYVRFDEDGAKSGIMITTGRFDYLVEYNPPVNFMKYGVWRDYAIDLNSTDSYLQDEINDGLWKEVKLNSIRDIELRNRLKHKLHYTNAFYGISELEDLAEQKIYDKDLVKLIKKEINKMGDYVDGNGYSAKKDFEEQVDYYVYRMT